MTYDPYWKRIDGERDGGLLITYERRMPHGTLVLTETHWNGQLSTSMVFVPNPVVQVGWKRPTEGGE